MGGSVNKLVGTLSGGLLGQPEIKTPKAPKDQKTAAGLDPNQGAALSAARRKKQALAGAANRSSFRIDLGDVAGGAPETRSGITIG